MTSYHSTCSSVVVLVVVVLVVVVVVVVVAFILPYNIIANFQLEYHGV